MAKCELCGKAPIFGHNVSHAENKTNRRWLPNVQKHTIYREGRRMRLYLCTKCLRTLNRETPSH